jgi:hypothetical protein
MYRKRLLVKKTPTSLATVLDSGGKQCSKGGDSSGRTKPT